ncbi:MAG: sigma-70 family RNA polymerase sigma factor, partial [Dehalococcoidia bacterium]|nr:sigma-70 family RNA polymerase sigma factor [Dehalococcoidia bacterium]
MDQPERERLERALGDARGQFLAFVRIRVADPELAEDILQDALLRAVRSIDTLRDEARLVPWFYQVLRNAIVDAYRRRVVNDRRTVALEAIEDRLPDETIDGDIERSLCGCFLALVPTLKPEYRSVLEAVDLGAETPADAALRLGITTNNLKVRRHRARAALREQTCQTCQTCSVHGCLDCTCESAPIAD